MSIKETLSEKEQVGVTKRNRFAMIPVDVLGRRDITSGDKLILMAMNMESFGTGYAAVSDGVLSDICGISRPRVVDARRHLENGGLVARDGIVKQVQVYRLLHPDMQGLSRELLTTKTNRSKKQLTPCVLCKDPCVPQKRTGWCRKCSADARNRTITKALVREEVATALSGKTA